MGAFVTLAVEVIPLLVQAGMSLEPVVEPLISVNKDNITDADWKVLHDARAAALSIINDKSRDV